MKATTLIARRYLFSKKKVSLVSVLTLISISGVTLGTALLIIVLSVFNGFFDLVQGWMMAQDPDIRIESATGRSLSWEEHHNQLLSEIPEIQVVSPYVEGKALVALRGGDFMVARVRGVDTEAFSRMFELETFFAGGDFDLSIRDRRPGVLMSRQKLSRLGLDMGADLRLISAESIQRSLTQFSGPRNFAFEVRGSYRLIQPQDDAPMYIEKAAAQRLFNMRASISGVDLQLTDHRQADAVKARLQAALGPEYSVRTWFDLQKALYDVMNLEKWGAYIILMIIVLVAVLNIVGSLTMIVIQKTKDIAMLRSIGFTPADIRAIFLKQGLIIGLIGCGLGGSAGILLTWLQDRYGMVKMFGAESFIIDAYPVVFAYSDLALILSGSLILCIIASLYPAKRASQIEITDGLRYE
ncbi:MAG: FtsX-like permease family protein [Candidatus Cyclonatronum sp.]|uniref:FtsX-like permease family protein n=1 Tax=Cyclonatronum sp. TaxID=3024185 RepID=UPI0025BC1B06|nr:FtsX-like permease family protein [Cyclonatronum sp.]MCH8486512.1 FtsX-like permease family protein [Cyclonatronum sp.]